MRMKENILLFAAIATLLAGCSGDEASIPPNGVAEETPVSIASACMAQTTRAGYEEGEITDGSLALYFKTEGLSIDDRYQADCEKWTYADGWGLSPDGLDTKPLIWNNLGHSGELMAFYPYQACTRADLLSGGKPVSVAADQTDAATWNTVNADDTFGGDLLYAYDTAITSGTLNLRFEHLLAKLKVEVAIGSELASDAKVESLTIGGTKLSGAFHPDKRDGADAFTFAADAAAGDIKAWGNGASSFEAIVIPQTAALTLTAKVNTGGHVRTFTKALPDMAFARGTAYSIHLQVGATVVNVSNVKVNRWEEVPNAGDFSAI